MHKPFYSNQKEMWEPLSYNISIVGFFFKPISLWKLKKVSGSIPGSFSVQFKMTLDCNVLWSHKCCTKACHQTGCFFVIINKWTSNPTWVNIKEKHFCYFYISMYENPLIGKWLLFLVKIWKCKFLYPWKITWSWGTNVRCFFYWCDKNCGDYF